jgi:hypothetical protein
MQSALGEGDREGDDFCANMEDRDKETEVLGGALLMLDIGADFPLGYTVPSFRGNATKFMVCKFHSIQQSRISSLTGHNSRLQ